MYGEIVAIGNELISGRVVNTTSSFAASKLFAAGYPVNRITTIGDDPESIRVCLLAAIGRSRFVLVTGGLGPTSDDITNEVVAKALGRRLALNQEILNKIRQAGSKWGLTPLAMREKLAWLPEGAEVLNPNGRAAGYVLQQDGVPVFFLPGIPHQLEDHMVQQVLPRLDRVISVRSTSKQRTFKVFGLLETEINAMIGDLDLDVEGISIGYYPNFPEVYLTLTAKHDDPETADASFRSVCQLVEGKLGRNVVARDDETLEGILGRLLSERGMTLALAESCTGGLIGCRLTSIPGSSGWFERGVVSYSNRSKQDLLNVSPDTLARYGAVSEHTAREMAEGIRTQAGTDFGLAVTGIAGPSGGTHEKPVGTVFIAMATPEKTPCYRFLFPGSRNAVQVLAAETALDWLRRHLSDGEDLPGYRPAG